MIITEEIKISRRKRQKEWRHRRNLKAKELYKKIGKKCFICDSIVRLVCHRKDGKPHVKFSGMSMKMIEKVNPKEYVRLCYPCHYGVHWVYDYLSFSWEDIEKNIPTWTSSKSSVS